MILYSTCAGCGGLLHVTDGLDHHNGNPICTPKRTKMQRLTADWLAAAEAGHDDLADRIEAEILELDQRPPRLGAAAATYASWGWPVFPLKPHSKTPATRHGFKDATTDLERIRAWWTRHPTHNVGLPTGHLFDVIDVDVPAGPRTLIQLADVTNPDTGRPLLPDAHALAATSSGGMHYYIKPQGKGNRAAMMPGIDFRGVGGYVVAPPSTLGAPGRAWSWVAPPSPEIKADI